jgi:transaldolase/glucose-6-phosphate isomerase
VGPAQFDKEKTIILTPNIGEIMKLNGYRQKVDARLAAWQAADFGSRLWRKDPGLWPGKTQEEIANRLGWLTLPEEMRKKAEELTSFAREVKGEGMRHVVLLGMGGSSLAPEVFQRTFGNAPGYPELIVLDSTHPDAVRAVEKRVDVAKTLFLVSSKSGTTTETLSFFYYFWAKAGKTVKEPGRHFAAISDPGTPLQKLAGDRKFRGTFPGPEDVGGRYSAMSYFGLVPAALIGVEVARLLDLARQMAEACGPSAPARRNPGLVLGAALGELALAGRDKVTFFTSPSLGALPVWVEQLIAESTGKDDKGIVPVADEPAGSPQAYGQDRVFVRLGLAGESQDDWVKALEASGHPVIDLDMEEKASLGAEFFRWEVATAAAGAALGIHPFNQPDVQLAKSLAKKAMEEKSERGAGAAVEDEGLSAGSVRDLLGQVRPGDYISLQAYLAPNSKTGGALQKVRATLRDKFRVATTLGYGPRFLHSTGQLHKGGPNSGVFVQLLDDPAEDLKVPETNYSFGELIKAQALGDYQALKQRNRRVLRINLGRDVAAGLERLAEVVGGEKGVGSRE